MVIFRGYVSLPEGISSVFCDIFWFWHVCSECSEWCQVRIAQILDLWTSPVSGRPCSRSKSLISCQLTDAERTYAKDDAMQALAKKIDTLVFKFMLVSQKCTMTTSYVLITSTHLQ